MKEQDTQAALDTFPDGMNYQGQYVWDWFTKNSTTIRAALTAQLTKTPENVTCGDVSNSGDVQAALNSLFRLENDALSSRDGYGYSSGDAEIIRRVIMQYAELKENALTAQDVNAELLERAKALVKYCEWQINEGTDHHPTLPSAIVSAKEAIARAEAQKGGE